MISHRYPILITESIEGLEITGTLGTSTFLSVLIDCVILRIIDCTNCLSRLEGLHAQGLSINSEVKTLPIYVSLSISCVKIFESSRLNCLRFREHMSWNTVMRFS